MYTGIAVDVVECVILYLGSQWFGKVAYVAATCVRAFAFHLMNRSQI